MKSVLFVTLFLVISITVGCAATDGVDTPALANSDNTPGGPASAVRPDALPKSTPAATFTPINTLAPLATTTGHIATIESTTPSLPPPTIRPTLELEQPATPADTLDSTPSTADIARTEELVNYGLQVYKEQYCGVCHKLDVAATGGLFGPEQNGIGTTAEQRIQDPDYTGTAQTAAEYIRESIVNPQAYLVEGFEQSRHHMPAFAHLNENDLNALVQMLRQQR